MSLKEKCRERIFSIINKITEKSKYVIMIVDSSAYKVLTFVCKNEELLERGVSLIEHINANRSSLNDFDCIYFLSSNIHSVQLMLKDFPDEKNGKYKNIHILFTPTIGKNSKIIELIANNDFILKKIKSCASINMDFLAYESRAFYFENAIHLYDLFPLRNAECLSDISSKLISVCSCLNITWPSIRYQNSSICRKFAEIFYNGICNAPAINEKNNTYEENSSKETEKKEDDLVLILDRSIDSTTLFVHDYSYQSLCYDILKIKTTSEKEDESYMLNTGGIRSETRDGTKNGTVEGTSVKMERAFSIGIGGLEEEQQEHTCVFEITNNEQQKEEKKAILSEDDTLWVKYRHLHIQDVHEMVKNEIAVFSEQNAVARLQKKNILNPTEALDALRSLPQYESMIEKYWLHVYLCNSCFKLLQKKNIVDIGVIEQDLCCNVDRNGKELTFNKNTAGVHTVINNEEYEQEEKARVLLLYFINYVNISEYDKMKIIESAQLGLFMQKIIKEFLQLKIHSNNIYIDSNNLTGNKVHHILEKNKEKIKYYKNVAKKAKYELSRHEPNIKDLILQIHNNTLNKTHFHFVDATYNKNCSPGSSAKGMTDISEVEQRQNVSRGTVWNFNTSGKKLKKNEKKKKILIFIIGGITYSEIKYVYELSNQLHMDIYIGGTSVLTANTIFSQFKNRKSF